MDCHFRCEYSVTTSNHYSSDYLCASLLNLVCKPFILLIKFPRNVHIFRSSNTVTFVNFSNEIVWLSSTMPYLQLKLKQKSIKSKMLLKSYLISPKLKIKYFAFTFSSIWIKPIDSPLLVYGTVQSHDQYLRCDFILFIYLFYFPKIENWFSYFTRVIRNNRCASHTVAVNMRKSTSDMHTR